MHLQQTGTGTPQNIPYDIGTQGNSQTTCTFFTG